LKPEFGFLIAEFGLSWRSPKSPPPPGRRRDFPGRRA